MSRPTPAELRMGREDGRRQDAALDAKEAGERDPDPEPDADDGPQICDECNGTGETRVETMCRVCRGSGEVTEGDDEP